LAVVYGIEPMIIVKDICGASDRETEAVVRWMMDALVDAALREPRERPRSQAVAGPAPLNNPKAPRRSPAMVQSRSAPARRPRIR
jgi:hypothetical protein